MVLPEGVLNNKNLQAVREYFEGKAKIILICSIPQDVFIAAGATVKPSLVFMRRFTNDEESEKWLIKSVKQNNAMAQWLLGILYLEGKENDIKIEENKEYGIELLKKSAEQGYEEAIKKLKEISNI